MVAVLGRSGNYSRNNPLAELEDTDDISSDSPQDVSFPDEIVEIDHWVTFRAFETKQLNRAERPEKRPLAYISLPIPGNLSTAYNISYSDIDLGAFRKIVIDSLSEGPNTAQARADIQGIGLGALAGGIFGGFSGTTAGIASGMTAGIIAGGAIQSLVEGSTVGPAVLSTAIGANETFAAIGGNFGIARNPHKVVLFNNVGFRTHEFSYSFSPKSYEEAEMLRKIITLFKLYASPSFNVPGEINVPLSGLNSIDGVDLKDANIKLGTGRHFFKYPEYFEIDFHHPKFLFQIGPSVIEQFSVDYHPQGVAYARTEGREPTPVGIGLRISFRETEIVTKESILKENR